GAARHGNATNNATGTGRDVEGSRPVDGGERGMTDAEDNRVGPLDLDAAWDVVHTGGKEKVPASRELVVDDLHRVRRCRDEEVVDRYGPTRRSPVGPGDAAGVPLRGRHADVELPVFVGEQVRRPPAEWSGLQRRVRRVREAGVVRGADDAREHLVPDAVGPTLHLTVAGQPLLLGSVDSEWQDRVGDESAARKLRSGRAVVHQ